MARPPSGSLLSCLPLKLVAGVHHRTMPRTQRQPCWGEYADNDVTSPIDTIEWSERHGTSSMPPDILLVQPA
jgi:hypothetical protein